MYKFINYLEILQSISELLLIMLNINWLLKLTMKSVDFSIPSIKRFATISAAKTVA